MEQSCPQAVLLGMATSTLLVIGKVKWVKLELLWHIIKKRKNCLSNIYSMFERLPFGSNSFCYEDNFIFLLCCALQVRPTIHLTTFCQISQAFSIFLITNSYSITIILALAFHCLYNVWILIIKYDIIFFSYIWHKCSLQHMTKDN